MISSRDTVPRAKTPEENIDPRLAAILASTSDQERDVLHHILRVGLDQGWFLRLDDHELLWPAPDEMRRLFDRLAGRDDVRLTEPDPWTSAAPPPAPISGTAPGWVVVTQRCDLIRSYRTEPVVELARATVLDGDAAAVAKTNSPRLVAFASGEGGSVWAADLRQRVWLPKPAFNQHMNALPVVADERSRKRFRLRLGQRYWRDPVPDDLVETLQRPLRDVVKNSSTRLGRLRNFVMWLGLRSEEGRVVVIAVAEDGREADAHEDWDELLRLLAARKPAAHALIEPDESGVYSADDISLGLWLDAFKFDFDELTYSRRADADHATPPR